ncbi:gluconokinase [Alkalicoccus chagannorensis]|uniref:gluconokinase n=1 Tax=Alkalicoccus chagannorensis TaxID=427072 RepID=UPI00040C0C58|nr:gluconokinase [Alkalicoccus chagannorensis]
MVQEFVMGIDIGTTSAKAVVFTREGAQAAEAEVGYDLLHPKPGFAEQDPYAIETAALEAIRQAQPQEGAVTAAGFSTAMHTLLLLDKHDEPLTNVITWADTRSSDAAAAWHADGKAASMYQASGTPVHPMSPISKLQWFREQEPALLARTSSVVSIKEFLLRRWFGESVIDYATAAASGLFSVTNWAWDPELLDSLSLTDTQFGVPVKPTYLLPPMKEACLARCGLPPETVFAIGSSDGALANIGIGALLPGETALTIGTSGAVRQFSSSPSLSPAQQTFSYAFDDGMWLVGGPTNNGGIALQWLSRLMGKTVEETIALVEDRPPAEDDPLFLPYLQGERAPVWDPNARGAFTGLSIEHGQQEMVRAVMEGVLFSVYDVFLSVEAQTQQSHSIRAGGGFARSPLWLQMTADVFGRTVELPLSHQSSAWGAAWCVRLARGEVDSYSSIRDSIPMQPAAEPDPERHARFQERFRRYRQLYPALHS